ncbi:hypothetical protein ABPG75_010169 [Micractinium tetrahymenae]
MRGTTLVLLAALAGLAAGQALHGTGRRLLTAGDSFDNPIDLGSPAQLLQDGDSTGFPDSALGECNDPTDYASNTTGDGGDVYFKWTAPFSGYLTAYTCSDAFQAVLTVLGNGTDADSNPIVNGNLGCGGVFDGCSAPGLSDPDSQLIIQVTAGQVLIFHVTGTEATDLGAFKLSLDLQKDGSSLSLATFLDAAASVTATGDSQGYPSTFTSPCTEANTTDGPDVFYSYSAQVDGQLTVKACGTGFNATVTILAEAAVEGGQPTPIGCGTCAMPAKATVVNGSFYFIVVSGAAAAGPSPFQLTVTNTAPPAVGGTFSNPINLGSVAKIVKQGDSSPFLDSVLSGCADPNDYGSANATSGDGGDVYYKWTAPGAGFVTVYACSDKFLASLTVLGNGTDADGQPIVNGNLGCGGVFDSCSAPGLSDPDSQLVLQVTAGQVLIFAVTGSEVNDYGTFRLSVAFELEGASLSTASYIGTKPSMSVAGTTKGYPVSYASQCNARKPDGPDRYYSYFTPRDGILTVKACGTGFNATVTVMAEASVEGGKPTPLACGTCTRPARIMVQNETFLYMVVTGTKATDAGAFQLSVGVAPGAKAGGSAANPILLGSPSKLLRSADTGIFADTMLSGCANPNDYGSANATSGDGGDVFFKWVAPSAGYLNAYACSDVFEASMTVIGDGMDADGKPIKNGVLACGGVFRNCADRNIKDPDSQLYLEVKKGQPLTFAVTGTEASDFGPAKLGQELSLPGSSFALANYIGNRASMTASGSTKGYPATFASKCNAGKPDGPDMYFSFAGPLNGTLTAKACGTGGFGATVTVFAEAAVEGGKPTALGCGTCAKPAVIKGITKDSFYYLIISGTKPTDAGTFKLTLTTAK